MRSMTGTIRDRRPIFGMQQDQPDDPQNDTPVDPGDGLPPVDPGDIITDTGGPQTDNPPDPGGDLPHDPGNGTEAPPDFTGGPAAPPEESSVLGHVRRPPPPPPNVNVPGTFATGANPSALAPFRTPAFGENRFTGANASFGPGTPLASQDGGGTGTANSFEELLRRLRTGGR